jgi:hypothetical protein
MPEKNNSCKELKMKLVFIRFYVELMQQMIHFTERTTCTLSHNNNMTRGGTIGVTDNP